MISFSEARERLWRRLRDSGFSPRKVASAGKLGSDHTVRKFRRTKTGHVDSLIKIEEGLDVLAPTDGDAFAAECSDAIQ